MCRQAKGSCALVLALALAACTTDAPAPSEEGVAVEVVDEVGAPLRGAVIEHDGGRALTGDDGRARVVLGSPALAVVRAPGHLPEPLPLAPGDGEVTVRLLSDHGGRRFVLHSAGDVMFGRRYEAPPSGEPLIAREDPATGARAVVAGVVRLFGASDLRTLNLETVVSDLPDDAGYPGKRFLLRSREGALAGVAALGADVVVLANNHQRDWLDDGVADTLAALDRAGLARVGAGLDAAEAALPLVREVRGTRVGVLAWTTVDGSTVNDHYPLDGDPTPTALTPLESWQYQARRWGYDGDRFVAGEAMRRIGTAWRLFAAAEDELAGEAASVWGSLAAVYPELQDWVARRGHGGAAHFDAERAAAAISALRPEADLVVVQLHGGFQFTEAASQNLRNAARRAIDAGADLVVCHHPHVLQGLELYRGKLIAYSLGNFVFDQDFLATFASVVLRTVWEGNQLVEARLLPVEIVGYRPFPVVGAAARRTLATLHERSLLGAWAVRAAGGIYPILDDGPAGAPGFVVEHHTARLVTEAAAERRAVTLAAGEEARLDGLTSAGLPAGVELGRDLFGWGHFEDVVADGVDRGGIHWHDPAGGSRRVVSEDANRFLRLRRSAGDASQALARPVARVPLPQHRFYAAGAVPQPLDAAPVHSVRLRARTMGAATPSLRLDFFHFDDSDPTEDPESTLLASQQVLLPVATDGAWHALEVVPAHVPGANMVLVYLVLPPPTAGEALLDVDDLAVVEWRAASAMPPRFGRWDWLRNASGGTLTVEIDTR